MSHQGPKGGEIEGGLKGESHFAEKLDQPLVGPNHEAAIVPTSQRSQRPGGTVLHQAGMGLTMSAQ